MSPLPVMDYDPLSIEEEVKWIADCWIACKIPSKKSTANNGVLVVS